MSLPTIVLSNILSTSISFLDHTYTYPNNNYDGNSNRLNQIAQSFDREKAGYNYTNIRKLNQSITESLLSQQIEWKCEKETATWELQIMVIQEGT